MVSSVVVFVSLLAQAPLVSLLAQAPQDRASFFSRTELVVLHVSVADRRSGFVAGLPRESFTVYEDGRRQQIDFFQNEDTPVTVGLVVDSSGSMARKRDAVIAAGLSFATSSHPADEMFTIHFNERVWAGLPASHPFTSDREELRRALQRSRSRGKTALFDGLETALGYVARGQKTRRALIVISDGADNASGASFQQVLDTALRMDAVIYAVGLADAYDGAAKPKLLRKLADSTGGEAFFPKSVDEVGAILEQIARDIRSGYTIGYVPGRTGQVGYRKVRVDVRSPRGGKLTARARSGYVAEPAAGIDVRK